VILPFKILPQVYIVFSLVFSWLFELQIDWRLFPSFFFAWFTMRMFLRTRNSLDTQIGEPSPNFSLGSFFPSQWPEV